MRLSTADVMALLRVTNATISNWKRRGGPRGERPKANGPCTYSSVEIAQWLGVSTDVVERAAAGEGRFVRRPTVCRVLRCDRSHLYRMERDGSFCRTVMVPDGGGVFYSTDHLADHMRIQRRCALRMFEPEADE